MKKVVYSVSKIGGTSEYKLKGVGFVTDTDLITAQISRNGKPYIRVFDCVTNCHAIEGRDGEFKGFHYEFHEVDMEKENGSTERREIEVNYQIWYKYIED